MTRRAGSYYVIGYEVEDHVGATAGEVRRRGDLATVGDHGMLRAELLGELERVRVAVHHDDLRGGERGQALDADVAEPAGPDDDRGGAGPQQRDGLADRMVGGDARVGQRRDILRLGGGVELDAGPGGGQ